MVFFVFVLWMVLGAVGVRPRRDFEALEERRKKAARLFARGRSQADVARELEVSRQSVSRWYAEWSANGTSALSKAGRAGRLPKLSPAQLRRVATELEKGPRSHGYPTDLWTLRRVGEVIEKTTGSPITRAMSGRCCANSWAGAASDRHAVQSSATMRRSPAG